jgi:hypothetical protein
MDRATLFNPVLSWTNSVQGSNSMHTSSRLTPLEKICQRLASGDRPSVRASAKMNKQGETLASSWNHGGNHVGGYVHNTTMLR